MVLSEAAMGSWAETDPRLSALNVGLLQFPRNTLSPICPFIHSLHATHIKQCFCNKRRPFRSQKDVALAKRPLATQPASGLSLSRNLYHGSS